MCFIFRPVDVFFVGKCYALDIFVFRPLAKAALLVGE